MNGRVAKIKGQKGVGTVAQTLPAENDVACNSWDVKKESLDCFSSN